MESMRQLEVTPPDHGERSVRTPHPSNATLSTIRDLSVAASSAAEGNIHRPSSSSWIPLVLFFFAFEAVSAASARFLLPSLLWKEAVAVTFLPVFGATVLFWLRGRVKARARVAKTHANETEEALKSFGYEAANAVNAIRANLIGVTLAHPDNSATTYLNEVKQGVDRIEAAINRAEGALARFDVKRRTEKLL